MSAAIVIPARLASTRLPGKMLLDRTGLPLVCHTLLTAVTALRESGGRFSGVIVATDDESVRRVVEDRIAADDLPARCLVTRADHPTGSDRIAEAVASLPEEVEVIVNLQGDEPEIDPADIAGLADMLSAGGGPDMATLAWPIRDPGDFANPNLVKVVLDGAGEALYFSRAPIPYDREPGGAETAGGPLGYGHLGIYAYRREALDRFVSLPPGVLERTERLEQLRALENGMRIAVRVLDARPAKGIDTEEDYAAFVARSASR